MDLSASPSSPHPFHRIALDPSDSRRIDWVFHAGIPPSRSISSVLHPPLTKCAPSAWKGASAYKSSPGALALASSLPRVPPPGTREQGFRLPSRAGLFKAQDVPPLSAPSTDLLTGKRALRMEGRVSLEKEPMESARGPQHTRIPIAVGGVHGDHMADLCHSKLLLCSDCMN